MPDLDKLPLEDVLEDNPQTRSLVGVFEEDAKSLRKYIQGFHYCCSKVVRAEEEMATALKQLSKHLLTYESQNFPVEENTDTILKDTIKQFADNIEEVSSWHASLATQLTDSMAYPLSKFLEGELKDLSTLEDIYKVGLTDLDKAYVKYAKFSKKKDPEHLREDARDEVYACRRKYHQIGLHYFKRLNQLQYSRKLALIEPLLGYMQALKTIFCIGHNVLTIQEAADDFLANIHACVQGVYEDMNKESKDADELIDSIVAQSDVLYHAETPPDLPQTPTETDLLRKSGHLFIRSRYMGVVANWDRSYFYTEGGNLMMIPKGELAGTLVIELTSSTIAQPLDNDERTNVFQITNGKKSVVLQAMNSHERDEWVFTLMNIVKEGGYVKESPRTSQSSILTGMSQFFADRFTPQSPDAASGNSSHSSRRSSKHHSKSITPSSSASTPFELLLPSTPIMFDLPSLGDKTPQQNGGKGDEELDGPPKRINPFDESCTSITTQSLGRSAKFSEIYTVRFLGCVEVQAEKGQQTVWEAIRQIMTARAIHNIFRATEVHLVVTEEGIQFVDPSSKTVRTHHRMEEVTYWASHKENERLFGYIVCIPQSNGSSKFHSFVVESNCSGEEIVSAIASADKIRSEEIEEEKRVEEVRKKEMEILLANIKVLDDLDDGEESMPIEIEHHTDDDDEINTVQTSTN